MHACVRMCVVVPATFERSARCFITQYTPLHSASVDDEFGGINARPTRKQHRVSYDNSHVLCVRVFVAYVSQHVAACVLVLVCEMALWMNDCLRVKRHARVCLSVRFALRFGDN